MGLKFIDKLIKSTLIAAAILFPFLSLHFGFGFATSVLLGAGWSSLNLLLLKLIVVKLVTAGKRRWRSAAAMLFVKFTILYGLGYLLVTRDFLSGPGLLWGFSGVFITAFLNALSRVILGLDRRAEMGESST